MKDLGDSASDLESRVRARTAELSETQDQLVLAGKMAAIGTLVAGLSHELNNPIGVILGSAQVLLERATPGDPATRALAAIERQARRCASLVNALLDFSRARAPTREPHAAGSLLERVAHLASGHPRRHQVRLALAPAEGLPTIEVCATEIESALLNLIGNAFDATPSGGAIEVRAQAAAIGGRDGVEFSVRDSGDGIPDEVLPRIFDPFFTTKVAGQGHRPRPEPHAQDRRRARRAHRRRDARRRRHDHAAVAAGIRARGKAMTHKVVLVVDDEPDMLDTFVMVLQPLGYEIFTVVSGEAALQAIGERRFDLVITDFMMPGLDGAQTLDAMKSAAPGVPVLVVTGFVTEDVFNACNRHGAAAIVKKPFGVKEFRELVARLLESA